MSKYSREQWLQRIGMYTVKNLDFNWFRDGLSDMPHICPSF